MNKAYLLTGGNMGDRAENLSNAVLLIKQFCGEITVASRIYETAAWGNTQQPNFLNQVLELKTELTALQLIRRILKIEKQMGRVRNEKFGPRIIDIDILFFNDEIIGLPFLKIPHTEIQHRRFVLIPLCEIAPELIHPQLNSTISELLKSCTDKLDVKKFN